jgi:hypothetical protein
MTPLTGNRELALASWRLVETLGAPGAESYVAVRIQRAMETQAACEVVVWRMVADAVRRLTAESRRAGATLH